MSICPGRATLALMTCAAAIAAGLAAGPAQEKAAPTNTPRAVDTRTIDVTQMVTLKDVPAGAKHVRMWIPVPSDGPWQRVLDKRVVLASGEWRLERLPNGRGEFVVVDVKDPKPEPLGATVQCIVETRGVASPLNAPAGPADPGLFKDALDKTAPLMTVDARIQKMADDACGKERDPVKQARKLLQVVANSYDHWSKDGTKPKFGRGSAEECAKNGGGSCTDLHSMFIALARARGIPARIQFGYRTLDANVGTPFDPGSRCWVEFFVPGAGWIPTDIVAADGAAVDGKLQLGSLSATRVWLWEGRSFDLVPPAKAGPIHTMTCGWAEIDGKPVEVMPSADGAQPSSLTRTVQFKVIDRVKEAGTPALPE